MAKKIRAYVDSGAFIAFLDRSDSYHALFARLFAAPPNLITTPLVITETHAWFLRRYDASKAMQFLGFVETLTPLKIEAVGREELLAAVDILREFSDQNLTLVDACGITTMVQHRIDLCWSVDRHLGLKGARLAVS